MTPKNSETTTAGDSLEWREKMGSAVFPLRSVRNTELIAGMGMVLDHGWSPDTPRVVALSSDS